MRLRENSILGSLMSFLAAIFFVSPAFAGASVGPEIDPGTATGGLALLAATILIVVERYRRR